MSDRYPYLSLARVLRWEPVMAAQNVSRVARSASGFLRAYEAVDGDARRLSAAWKRKRAAFLARHMGAQAKDKAPLWWNGQPSRRHLALIAWAYSPEVAAPKPKVRKNEGPRAVARWYKQQCGWPKALVKKITGKKYPKQSSRRALTDTELPVFMRLAGAYTEPVGFLLRFLPLTGLRIAEACSFSWKHVKPTEMKVLGKGQKWRVVPLSPEARRVLQEYAKAYPPESDGRVFACSPGQAQRACRTIGTKMGIPLTPHVLRHTYATQAVRRCVPPRDLQAALGHDSFRTTLIYLHSLT